MVVAALLASGAALNVASADGQPRRPIDWSLAAWAESRSASDQPDQDGRRFPKDRAWAAVVKQLAEAGADLTALQGICGPLD